MLCKLLTYFRCVLIYNQRYLLNKKVVSKFDSASYLVSQNDISLVEFSHNILNNKI